VTVGQDLFRIEPGEKGATPPPKGRAETQGGAKPAQKAPESQAPKQPEPSPQAKAAEKPKKQPEPSKEKPAPKQAAAAGNRGETRVKMNRMRLTIAKRLKESQNAAAALTTFNEIDMSALMAFRKKYKDEVSEVS
jgi:2-oxoglutarate dehydrogenase E2 component (dihydrolipoamide succinyltransferase)